MRWKQILRNSILGLSWIFAISGLHAATNDTLTAGAGCATEKFWNISTGGVADTLFVEPGANFSLGLTYQIQYPTTQCQSSSGRAESYFVAINGGTQTNYTFAYLLLADAVSPGAVRGPTTVTMTGVAPTAVGYYYFNPGVAFMYVTSNTVGEYATTVQSNLEQNTIAVLAVRTRSVGITAPPSNTGKIYTYVSNACITQTVTNVMLNGMRDTLFASPGATLNVSFDWQVQYSTNYNCMSSSTVINYANGLEHYTGSCINQGYFSPGEMQRKTVAYAASTPSTPGTYYLNLGTTTGGSYTCSANATLINTVPLGNGPSTIGVVVVTSNSGNGGGSTTTNSGNFWQANSNGIYYNGGNVGINCTTTNSKLDVNGSIAINHVQVIDGGGKWTGQSITGTENVTPRLSGNGNNIPLDLAPQGASTGQVLKWNGSSWAPGTDNGGSSSYAAGNGLTLTGNTFSANTNSPIWNANQLQNIPVLNITPLDGQYLFYNAGEWFPSDLPTPVFRAGTGITVDGNLISAQTTSPLWNANALNSNPLPQVSPQIGQSLIYQQSGWTYGTVGGQNYSAGTGIAINGNTISAENSAPIWNASSLNSKSLPQGAPKTGQSLLFGISGWEYDSIAAPEYEAGMGISIDDDLISAQSSSPMWNANQLSGHNIGTIAPETGQVLQYNGVAWVPEDLAAPSSAEANGWEMDTLQGGIVNLLSAVNGSVGIGTDDPQAELDVFGGIAVKGIQVINDSGQWVGPVVIDSATQALMDTMEAQQAAINASMDQLKQAQDSLTAGMTKINQGSDMIKQGDSLLQAATNSADSAAAQAMIDSGQSQIAAGQASVSAGQSQSSAASSEMAATISGLSATLSAASAVISVASATAAALAAIEASAAAAEASIAAGEATIAAAEATGAAVEASLAALEATGAASDATADAADASADAATATRKASEASGSADDAKDSAKDAKNYADQAKEYAEGNVGGDLSGTMPNPTVAKIQGHAVSTTAPTANKVLKYINNQWTPAADSNTTYRAGTGITIRHDSIFAQSSSPMWNANKLEGRTVAGTVPSTNQVLKWRNNTWMPANDSTVNYKAGLGILIRRDSIFAKNDSAIWNATKLKGRAIASTAPSTNQVLKWRNNAWTPATDSTVNYKAGTGITIRHDSIFAQNTTAIWNAKQLQGIAVSDTAPVAQQVLKFLNGKWKPAVDSVLHYKGGTGIAVRHDSIFALADSAIWNSNALSGYEVDTLRPDSGQILTWNGAKWQPQAAPQTSPQGWALDTMAGDTIMYSTVPGNIGIGTTRPTQRFMVQGGSTAASDSAFVVNSAGQVGIGTANPSANFKLSVNGAIRAKKVVVESGWADYVFDQEYSLRPLPELRKYIAENHHLPGVESADAIAENGLDLAKTQQQMMEKIEELTLYLLQMEAQNARLQAEIQTQNARTAAEMQAQKARFTAEMQAQNARMAAEIQSLKAQYSNPQH